MEANVYSAEKFGLDQLPSSYPPEQPIGQPQPLPTYYPQVQPTGYPNTHQPQPMVYPNMQQSQVVFAVESVKDYMSLSLLTLLCCCWPIGICALVNSLRVRDALRTGDHIGAMNASRTARILNIVGIVSGCVLIVVVIIVAVVVAITNKSKHCSYYDRRYGRC